jgi:hypothetical protein
MILNMKFVLDWFYIIHRGRRKYMKYFKIVGAICLNIFVFGILSPFLISYPDTLLILIGFLFCIIMIYVDYIFIKKILKKEKKV